MAHGVFDFRRGPDAGQHLLPPPRLPGFPRAGHVFGGIPTPTAPNDKRYAMAAPPRVQLGDFNFDFGAPSAEPPSRPLDLAARAGGVTPLGGAATPTMPRGATTPNRLRDVANSPGGHGAPQPRAQDSAPPPKDLHRGSSAPQRQQSAPSPQACYGGNPAPQNVAEPEKFADGKQGCRATPASTPSTRTPASTPSSSPPRTPPTSPVRCGGGQATPHGRGIARRGHDEIVELMRNKDKLRAVSQRPFRELGEPLLGPAAFREALRGTLLELGVGLPSDTQICALFEKHSKGDRGVTVEDYEALLFRFLCFVRAHEDVDMTPKRNGDSTPPQQRDRRWRQDFIPTNPRQFTEVYEVHSKLGQGNFGTVYKVSFKQCSATGKSSDDGNASVTKGSTTKANATQQGESLKNARVCKVISKDMAQKSGLPLSKVREELHVLKNLDHPHILRIFENFEDDNSFFMIMETALGGDLQAYMRHMEPTDAATYEQWVALVMFQSLAALSYCHKRGVVHKDLKPENVMLSTPMGTPLHAMHVVLVDFGLSECFSSPDGRSNVISGTPPYMAPEVWTRNSGKACDLWSCGIMLFFMLSGRFPFHCKTPEEFAKATATLEPDWTAMGGASSEAHDLCKQLLQKSDAARVPAPQAMQHAWFSKQNAHGSSRAPLSRAEFESIAAFESQAPLSRAEFESIAALPHRTEFEKFLSRIVATQLDAGPQTRINGLFHALDGRGDGVLSIDALAQGLVALGMTLEQAKQVAKELDVAKRGRVSYTEFLAGFLDLRSRSELEQDEILRLAWQQLSPGADGQVKANDVQNALAARGMTVADLPAEFLSALRRDATGYITFAWFKRLLLPGSGGLTPPARESPERKATKSRPKSRPKSRSKSRPTFFDRFFIAMAK